MKIDNNKTEGDTMSDTAKHHASNINLNDYTNIIISISGGKDSQTIVGVMTAMAREQNYQGTMIATHADTGAEWNESLPHCEMLCEHYSLELVVAHPYRDLPDHIEQRCAKCHAQCKPGWPSSAAQ